MDINAIKIENKIYYLRGLNVMLDSDLAELYQMDTKRINEQVKRNHKRFPENFMFQVNHEEWEYLKSQFATSLSKQGGRRKIPYVFTEQGVAMLSAVLNSEIAIQVSIQIIQTFIAMRRTLGNLTGIIQRLDDLEIRQLKTDGKLEKIFNALEIDIQPKQGVFYEGQLFDAHVFVSSIIKQAKKSLVLIDNYVDENTLLLLSKRKLGVTCMIYTRLNSVINRDLEKHNKQYQKINLTENSGSHDRFIIIDDILLYHFGASLKDLGNKCFAFSRMDSLLMDIKSKLLKA